MSKFILDVLSILFPPSLRKMEIAEHKRFSLAEPEVKSWCGRAQPKQYKDAIDKHWNIQS